MRQELWRNAGAGVADDDLDVRVDPTQSHLHQAVAGCEADGIREQIPDYLLKTIGVPQNRSGLRCPSPSAGARLWRPPPAGSSRWPPRQPSAGQSAARSAASCRRRCARRRGHRRPSVTARWRFARRFPAREPDGPDRRRHCATCASIRGSRSRASAARATGSRESRP